MRTLIVGCGYVGLALGAELTRQGHAVWGLRRSHAADSQMRAAGIHRLEADITRPESLAALAPAYDWVVHCVSASGGQKADYRRVYLDGGRHLLEWLGPAPPTKLVYTSSTGVYGQTDGSWVDEASPVRPVTETGRILLETESALLASAKVAQVPAVILRVAGIYGPGRGYWLQQFMKGEARLDGHGDRILNMIHRDDVVGAVIAALERGPAGRIFNAVDDEPVSQLDCFRWLSTALNQALPSSVPEETEGTSKRGTTSKRVCNDQLKQELHYRFRYPTFREGFSSEISRIAV